MSWSSIGLISITMMWIGLVFLVKNWQGNGSMTFSQHAAQTKMSRTYYAVLWILLLPPFYWFMIYTFSEKLELGLTFKIVASVASVFMLLAALIAEQPGWRHKAHRFTAFAMAALLPPLLVFIIFSVNVSILSILVSVFSLLFMCWSIYYFWLEAATKHNEKEHPRTLILQASYIALFHLSILIAYYL